MAWADVTETKRSIPAGAGETPDQLIRNNQMEVDPRGCGGDEATRRLSLVAGGRSPRVRGRLPLHRE